MNVIDKATLFLLRRKVYEHRAALTIAGGIGVGIGLLAVLGARGGARRRALVRDRAASALRHTGELLDKSARDLRNRSRGALAEARASVRTREVPDRVVVDRVRAKLGRVVSHPHAIEVEAVDGGVFLSGPILARELDGLISAVSAVRGVKRVDHQLEVHRSAEGIPSLQGAPRRTGERFELLQESWTPLTRVLVGVLGVGLVGAAVGRRAPLGLVLGGCGGAALLRASANRPFKRLLGLGAGRRVVDFQKTITVRAPIEEVFSFFASFENLPRFMAHLRKVERKEDGTTRWTAAGPAGVPVSWDAELTEYVPNEVIAWRSVPGAAIASAGIVRFQESPEGGTRLDIKMSYNPPAGALGHAVAALFGVDPKHAMNEDLVRFKSLIERGKTTAHGEEVRLSELAGAGAR